MDKGEKLNKNHKHEDLKNEVKDKVFGHLLTAFGLVVGLAWNDAIATFIAEFFPISRDTLFAKFIYALILTIAVVLFSFYVINFFKNKEK